MIAATPLKPLDAARETAAAWKFLHTLFTPPSPAQWEWLCCNSTRVAWRMMTETCGIEPSEIIPPELTFPEYEETYVGTFDIGVPVAICPLIETHWNHCDPVTSILHENVLFFKQFGLMIRTSGKESPDHVLLQTEFMSYLYTLEERFLNDSAQEDMVAQIRQAEKDFLERHLAYWTPLAAKKIESDMADSWPAKWVRLLAEFSSIAASQYATDDTEE